MYRLHGFFTQNTLKTLYVLEEVGAEYEFCFVDLGKGMNRTDEFRAMTPVGKVPVILAVGNREVEDRTVSVRRLGEKQTSVQALDDVTAALAVEATAPDLL